MWYFVFQSLSRCLLKVFFRLRVSGLENLPRKTNYIVVANHTSFLDPLVIAASIPQKIFCIALRNLYKVPFFKWAFSRLDALPSGAISTKAVDLLRNNRNVGLFPEGGISRDGRLKEFRRGAAMLALKTGRPIVPCAIRGAFAALPFGRWIPRPTPISVSIGKPIYLLKEFDDIIDDVRLQEGLQRIRTSIAEMLDDRKQPGGSKSL